GAAGGDRALGGDDVGGLDLVQLHGAVVAAGDGCLAAGRSEEHTSELQSRRDVVCRLLLVRSRVGGGVGAGEGQRLVAGVGGVGVAVGVLCVVLEVVRCAGGFCFSAAAPALIYTLSLHDALPIFGAAGGDRALGGDDVGGLDLVQLHGAVVAAGDGCLAAG